MAFTEDYGLFFDVDNGFAVNAQYSTYANAGTHPTNAIIFKVIFDKLHIDADGYQTSRPSCVVIDTDIGAFEEDAVITINGIDYLVKDWEEDGTGLTVMQLEAM